MTPSDPYRVTGPALLSFSGGRTSAYMLHQIVRAHGGCLPNDVIPVFANTGKEREETLRFVYECGSRWGVNVRWAEWRDGAPGFEYVGYNSANRKGEPFDALIAKKKRLPNWKERWCTQFLKVQTLFIVMRDLLGLEPGQFKEVIGLRDDEGYRIIKGLERASKDGRKVIYPLAKSKITKPDVMRFWLGENADPITLTSPLPQGFDLGLRDYEGNCDLCFLKGQRVRKRIIRDDPSCAQWWDEKESVGRGWFDRRVRVAALVDQVYREPELGDDGSEWEEYDAECGLSCGA